MNLQYYRKNKIMTVIFAIIIIMILISLVSIATGGNPFLGFYLPFQLIGELLNALSSQNIRY